MDSSDDDDKMFEGEDQLYSAQADDEDERWVQDQHRPSRTAGTSGHQEGKSAGRGADSKESENTAKGAGKDSGALHSDAQLSCPLCFTTLCMVCQRHERYQNQFRAVLVRNVSVNKEEVLTFPGPAGSTSMGGNAGGRTGAARKAPPGMGIQEEEGGGEELFHPVSCSECGNEVGVLDADEVYHLFNVIATG